MKIKELIVRKSNYKSLNLSSDQKSRDANLHQPRFHGLITIRLNKHVKIFHLIYILRFLVLRTVYVGKQER